MRRIAKQRNLCGRLPHRFHGLGLLAHLEIDLGKSIEVAGMVGLQLRGLARMFQGSVQVAFAAGRDPGDAVIRQGRPRIVPAQLLVNSHCSGEKLIGFLLQAQLLQLGDDLGGQVLIARPNLLTGASAARPSLTFPAARRLAARRRQARAGQAMKPARLSPRSSRRSRVKP